MNPMMFLSSDLARAARFQSIEIFANETCKYALPFRPVGKVGVSNRFAAVDFCLAIVTGHLRSFGIPTSGVARHLEKLDRTALEVAIEQLQDGKISEIFVGISPVLSWEDDFSGVFTNRAAVADALVDLDLVIISVGDRLQTRLMGDC
jgi:hypothetical protein